MIRIAIAVMAVATAAWAQQRDVLADFAWPPPAADASANQADKLFAEARAQLATNTPSAALELLGQALFLQKDHAGALHLSGLLDWKLGRIEEATRRLILATRGRRPHRNSCWALAAISAQAHSYAESVGWLKKAIRESPPEEAAQFLFMPYYDGLCDYAIFRDLVREQDWPNPCGRMPAPSASAGLPADLNPTPSTNRVDVPAAPDLQSALRLYDPGDTNTTASSVPRERLLDPARFLRDDVDAVPPRAPAGSGQK